MIRYSLKRPSQLDIGLMGACFRRFFKGEPWCEALICPGCKSFDDYGPNHTWGEGGPSVCPVCGVSTVPYWSDERVGNYLLKRDDSFGVVAESDDSITGWAWGYPLGDNTFYLDTVGIIEEQRKAHLVEHLTAFAWFLGQLSRMGYQEARTRTHDKARNVHLLLRRFGFAKVEPSTEDPERSYWVASLAGPLV